MAARYLRPGQAGRPTARYCGLCGYTGPCAATRKGWTGAARVDSRGDTPTKPPANFGVEVLRPANLRR
jgi:hypothetical protein